MRIADASPSLSGLSRPRTAAGTTSPDRFVPGLADPALRQAEQLRQLAQSQPRTRPLDSAELKLMLDSARFEDPDQGLEAWWGRLERAAAATGAQLDREAEPEVTRREVAYLDTADFGLRDRGYVLRRRQNKAQGALMIKFRSPDRAAAEKSDVSASKDYDDDEKFENDLTYQAQTHSLFAHSNKVKLKKIPKGELSEFSEVFPGLGRLGLDPDTPLERVNGHRIDETVYDLGKVRFAGGESAELSLSLWQEHDQNVIAEFSFVLEGEEQSGSESADRFMQALRRDSADWLGTGTTKTAWVYGARDPW